ncbi:circularly permuted type 2 ATP-grasp protein [Mycolicibacterium brumae]|nr:circularly permuted type 2 ATP-grasp protein [Mycolicibacterium brumae]UWW09144.1 circularly permuted type 2 ATP-grasp protein [Mycolicibacterium brumae]
MPVGPESGQDPHPASSPAWTALAEVLDEAGDPGLQRLRNEVAELVDYNGITAGAPDGGALAWRLDGVPLLVSAPEWETLEAGLLQRCRLLDALLTDLYGPQRALTSGVLPPQLVFAHPGYLRPARGITVPGRHQLFTYAADVTRAASGEFTVHADWTQAPSGAGYAMADRRVVAHAGPVAYERIAPRPVSPFATALRLSLIDAAPESAEDPFVVVLSPGIGSATAFDQAYLASALGFPLVESDDLMVRDGALWMRSLGTLKRVDVVLRRVDADYADPLDLRADSRLGVVGLTEVARRGAVTVVNPLGSGVLESPGVARFLPELARTLLGETPLLSAPPTFWGGVDRERSHLLARLDSLVLRAVTGGPPVFGSTLSAARREQLAARIQAAPWQWVGQELPQYSRAPTAIDPGPLRSAAVGMRLFTVSQRSGYTPMIGGLGAVISVGEQGVKNVAAKDIWVVPASRAQSAAGSAPVELPAAAPLPAVGVSSPRVLSDLYWTGRYAERAETMARLLNVTRERYHEYRHRQDIAASGCVPVLLSALGVLTGTDTGADGDAAEQIAIAPSTMWSLTVDVSRPGSMAQSVLRLGMAARSVRDQLSNDTWTVLAGVERNALGHNAAPPDSRMRGEHLLATAQARTQSGMLALSGLQAESTVRDVGWTMNDIGKRIERGQNLAVLLGATITEVTDPAVEQVVAEAVLTVCESAITYRRRTLGQISVAAMADLLLFDEDNPRSMVFQLERLRRRLRSLPGATGATRPERLVDEMVIRLRRLDTDDLEAVDADGRRRAALAGLLDAVNSGLRDLSDLLAATQLSLPGAMQPLWGPNQSRVLP